MITQKEIENQIINILGSHPLPISIKQILKEMPGSVDILTIDRTLEVLIRHRFIAKCINSELTALYFLEG